MIGREYDEMDCGFCERLIRVAVMGGMRLTESIIRAGNLWQPSGLSEMIAALLAGS